MSMTTTERAARTEAVWQEFQARLHAFVLRRVKAPPDADDILQEVFVRIHRNLDKIQEQDRLTAWIFQITRNAIADHYRAVPNAESMEPGFEPAALQEDSIELSDLSELSRCVQPMLGTLPKHYRDALELTDLGGMGHREAASLRHLSLSGMKSRVQRARQQLKETMLQCCQIELDRRGGIVDYSPRQCGNCSCGDSSGNRKPARARESQCRG
jgi:RNA polymerase sigma-70 factor (ECF subfamily)